MHSLYILNLHKNRQSAKLQIFANDINHAVGQASDICRALEFEKFDLNYGKTKVNHLSEIFKKLCLNDFSNKECCIWTGTKTNNTPCIYLLGKRYYIRRIILKYLDIPTDNYTTKLRCRCALCINPYHFEYRDARNSKLTKGDVKLLQAQKKQGTNVDQLALMLGVHRSTIYRKLRQNM